MNLKESFVKLSYQEKKIKLLSFLKELKTDDKVIIWTIGVIERHENISESFLEDTYSDLIDFANFIKNNNEKEAVKKLESISKNLKEISIKEEKEKKNVDDILNQL